MESYLLSGEVGRINRLTGPSLPPGRGRQLGALPKSLPSALCCKQCLPTSCLPWDPHLQSDLGVPSLHLPTLPVTVFWAVSAPDRDPRPAIGPGVPAVSFTGPCSMHLGLNSGKQSLR